MVGFGGFCLWLWFALISGGLHLGLNFHFIQLHVPYHNECNSTLWKSILSLCRCNCCTNFFFVVPYRLDVAGNTSSGTLMWQQLSSVRLVCVPSLILFLMTRARELFLAHKVWSVWNFVMIHVPFWFVQVWFHFHKSCSSLPLFTIFMTLLGRRHTL
jgi:hypothetical protein